MSSGYLRKVVVLFVEDSDEVRELYVEPLVAARVAGPRTTGGLCAAYPGSAGANLLERGADPLRIRHMTPRVPGDAHRGRHGGQQEREESCESLTT